MIEFNSMYLKLESFLEDFSEIEEVNKAYEIIGLKEIFRICYENKLILYASY